MRTFVVYFENGISCTISADKITEAEMTISFRNEDNTIVATFFKSKIAGYGHSNFIQKEN